MLFSSITFLYGFLPFVLFVWFIAPKQIRNWVLLASSLLFYAFGKPAYVLLLLISSLSGWLFSLYMQGHRDTKHRKLALFLSLFLNLLLLCFFKYADFLIQIANQFTGASIPMLQLPLPIGISFFTFQTMSYTIDVYRNRVPAQRNFFTFATFVSLFPQLIAGPVVRYSEIEDGLKARQSSLNGLSLGIRRFTFGLSKKVLIANAMDEICHTFRNSSEQSVLFFWIYAVAFTLQIYFDFSGYSDMAIGLGQMFGFRFPENFRYPYISRSITEFWHRWHITLGSWFRDYVYIPLGGNRTPHAWQWVRNIAVVWLLTGLWHGAAWNFVLWGGMYGILLLAEKLWLGKFLVRSQVLSRVYVLFFVTVGFVLFNANDLSQMVTDLAGLFGFGGVPLCTFETLYYLKSYSLLFLTAIVSTTPLANGLCTHLKSAKVFTILEPFTVACLLLACTACLVDGSFNPFLYFRF